MKKIRKIIAWLHWHIKVRGKNNEYNTDILLQNDVRLRIKGDNNKIIIGENCSLKNVVISIFGNDNVVKIGNDTMFSGLIVEMGFKWHNNINNSILSIGDKTTINSSSMIMLEDNSKIEIGEDCMFASGIDLWGSDTHSIVDLDGNLLNYGGNIKIGNHVWIGKDVKICKNAQISDNSIVGFNAVVASKFTQPNIVITGNPAKMVKENINWNRLSPQNYQLSK